ncbi:MAG TPA: CoA transferase, partial [Ilumatobacteraceae bacterium]|nr:CoA transferase [Ilumatobacteraceae bacterium]
VALAQRARTGKGSVVESPMVGAALATTAEQVIDFAVSGRLQTRLGNASPLIDQDVFRCAGEDAWLAVSFPHGSALESLRAVTGTATFEALARWCADRSATAAADALTAAGIPAAEVVWAHETAANPQLGARSFFEIVEHPVCGTHPYASWPVRFGSGPHRWNRVAAPTMGQHNGVILSELGYSAADIAELERERIITSRVIIDQHGW